MCRKVLIAVGLLCFLSATRAKADDFVYAYCPMGEGYVFLYDTPTGFQVLANLKCSQKVTVLGAGGTDRVQVRTADGKEGYLLKSSVGPNCVGFTKTDVITTSACVRAVRTSERWP